MGDMTVDHLRISEEPHGKTFQSLTIRGNYKVSDVRTMVSCVKDGLGYGFLDQSNLYASMKELGLVTLLPDYAISTADTAIYAVYPHRKQTKPSERVHHLSTRLYWVTNDLGEDAARLTVSLPYQIKKEARTLHELASFYFLALTNLQCKVQL